MTKLRVLGTRISKLCVGKFSAVCYLNSSEVSHDVEFSNKRWVNIFGINYHAKCNVIILHVEIFIKVENVLVNCQESPILLYEPFDAVVGETASCSTLGFAPNRSYFRDNMYTIGNVEK